MKCYTCGKDKPEGEIFCDDCKDKPVPPGKTLIIWPSV